MIQKHRKQFWIGIAMTFGGLFAGVFAKDILEWLAVPFMYCAVMGGGLIAHVFAVTSIERKLNQDPEEKRLAEIEMNDERNIALERHAKAKYFDLMTFVFPLLFFAYMYMDANWIVLPCFWPAIWLFC